MLGASSGTRSWLSSASATPRPGDGEIRLTGASPVRPPPHRRHRCLCRRRFDCSELRIGLHPTERTSQPGHRHWQQRASRRTEVRGPPRPWLRLLRAVGRAPTGVRSDSRGRRRRRSSSLPPRPRRARRRGVVPHSDHRRLRHRRSRTRCSHRSAPQRSADRGRPGTFRHACRFTRHGWRSHDLGEPAGRDHHRRRFALELRVLTPTVRAAQPASGVRVSISSDCLVPMASAGRRSPGSTRRL